MAEFEALLDAPDTLLFQWITGDAPVAEAHNTALFERIRTACGARV